MKAGKEYELLIANMYQSLEPNAEVTHDDHIYDGPAKIKRQIDVSIRHKLAGVDILIIVQAKDYKHKANVTVVDQFKTVIDDTKANKGILICSKGFSDAALTKAEFYNIECLTVHSAIYKKWETILKIPVQKIVHDFSLNLDFTLDVRSKAGKKVTMMHDTFSYDRKNIIGVADIVNDHIIRKMGWAFIKKQKKIRIDLKKMHLYHSIDSEMMPVTQGFVEISYVKSTLKKFYVDPANYTYSKDHIKNSGTLHNITISQNTLDNIIEGEHEHDKNLKDNPIISTTTYSFNNMETYFSNIIFSVKGVIEGKFFVKNKILMKDDERGRSVVELEHILKENQ